VEPHRIVRKHESVLKGHGFSRAADAKMMVLAAEEYQRIHDGVF
jgi:hypothetical protein